MMGGAPSAPAPVPQVNQVAKVEAAPKAAADPLDVNNTRQRRLGMANGLSLFGSSSTTGSSGLTGL